jgi:hypothetical protein
VKPLPVINAERVARALVQHPRCVDHLRSRLEWGHPAEAVAREAEGLYRAFRLEAFRDLPVAEKISWVACALIVRDLLTQRRPEDVL